MIKESQSIHHSPVQLSFEHTYLLVFAQYSALLAEENINGSFVVVFQRGSHDQIIEAVTVQIGHRSQSRAEASVLASVVDFQ